MRRCREQNNEGDLGSHGLDTHEIAEQCNLERPPSWSCKRIEVVVLPLDICQLAHVHFKMYLRTDMIVAIMTFAFESTYPQTGGNGGRNRISP
jgi:hypothetical protein